MLLFPTLGCGVEEALKHDVAGHDGQPLRVQPLARGRLGLRVRAPPHRGADALARRSRRRARGARPPPRARRPHRAHPPRAGARRARHVALARRQVARSGVGAPRRGVDPGRVPPRRQRLQRVHRDVGRRRELRGVRQDEHPEPDPRLRPRHPRHDRVAGRRRRVHPAPDAARREHRERLRLGGAAGEAAEEAGQPDAVGVQGGSARRDPRATCG